MVSTPLPLLRVARALQSHRWNQLTTRGIPGYFIIGTRMMLVKNLQKTSFPWLKTRGKAHLLISIIKGNYRREIWIIYLKKGISWRWMTLRQNQWQGKKWKVFCHLKVHWWKAESNLNLWLALSRENRVIQVNQSIHQQALNLSPAMIELQILWRNLRRLLAWGHTSLNTQIKKFLI